MTVWPRRYVQVGEAYTRTGHWIEGAAREERVLLRQYDL